MYILFDIGGTNMRLAASHDQKTFGEPVIVPTPKDFEDGIRVFNDLARKLAGGKPIKGAAGGVSASLSRDRRVLLNAPHHYGWNGKPLAQALEQAIGAPVYLENDSAIVGLGEAAAGAGRGERIVAYITISTGVGGARIVDGKVDVSAMGFEPGHQIIDAGGTLRQNSVGGRGVDFEGLISGSALTERYSKKPYELTDEKFWDEMARLTAYGINNTIVHWSPDVVVLGGSMMKKIGIPVDRVEAYLRGILHIFPELPKIKKAELADIGGLHGALAFLNYKQEKK